MSGTQPRAPPSRPSAPPRSSSDSMADPALQQLFKSWCSFVDAGTDPAHQGDQGRLSTQPPPTHPASLSEAAAINFIDNNPLSVMCSETANIPSTSYSVSTQRAYLKLDMHPSGSPSLQCLFDTGASVSLLKPSHLMQFQSAKLIRRTLPCSPTIKDASGTVMPCLGVYDLSFYLSLIHI